MKRPKIALAGAGSLTFTPRLLADFVLTADLHGAELALFDVNEPALMKVAEFAGRLLEAAEVDYSIAPTTDRAAALRDADFVVTSVEVNRFPTWRLDAELPRRFGIEQSQGENGGPGGLLHALRMIPHVVEICQDVDRLAPGALVLNLTNPLSRICKGIEMYSQVSFVGLCHEIVAGRVHLSHILERPVEEISTVAAGLNHFTWFLDIRDAASGEDLYPAVREAYPGRVTHDRLLTADIFRSTGVLCVTSDSHCGEYLKGGHIWETEWAPGTEPLAWNVELMEKVAEYDAWAMGNIVSGDTAPEAVLSSPSGEDIVDIISAHWHGRAASYQAVNLPNRGYIANLPEGAIVEVPGMVDTGGLRGVAVADLPEPMAAWCAPQCAIHELSAKAAIEGDRRAALEALLIDPVVPSLSQAEKCLDAMLEANREYLPRFYG